MVARLPLWQPWEREQVDITATGGAAGAAAGIKHSDWAAEHQGTELWCPVACITAHY